MMKNRFLGKASICALIFAVIAFFRQKYFSTTYCQKNHFSANARKSIHKNELDLRFLDNPCGGIHDLQNARKNSSTSKVLYFPATLFSTTKEKWPKQWILRICGYTRICAALRTSPRIMQAIPRAGRSPHARPRLDARTYPRRAHPSPSPKGAGRRVAQPEGEARQIISRARHEPEGRMPAQACMSQGRSPKANIGTNYAELDRKLQFIKRLEQFRCCNLSWF